LEIPELDLQLENGSLGSMFTTLEGLLRKMLSTLVEGNPFFMGDSSTNLHLQNEGTRGDKFKKFISDFEDVVERRRFPFTLIMQDPMGNSFVGGGRGLSPEGDEQIEVEEYERSEEEEEFLGLTGMDVGETEQDQEEERLADIITNPHHQGPDHPTKYTQGGEDES